MIPVEVPQQSKGAGRGNRSSDILGQAIRSAMCRPFATVDDAEYLRRFVDEGDESAFTSLFRRHAGMVYGAAI